MRWLIALVAWTATGAVLEMVNVVGVMLTSSQSYGLMGSGLAGLLDGAGRAVRDAGVHLVVCPARTVTVPVMAVGSTSPEQV